MVARVYPDRELFILDSLREAGLPGDESDIRFLTRRLLAILSKLGPEGEQPEMAGLLVAGLLRGLGLDPATHPRLAGIHAPESLLRSITPLLRGGFPVATWEMVRHGLLTYEGETWGGTPRWRLDVRRIAPVLEEWHELGECLVLRRVAESLLPLVRSAGGDLQIVLAGASAPRLRHWRRTLRETFEAANAPIPHFVRA